MSFGCGNGTKDRAILNAICSHLPQRAKILYHAVDPAADEIGKFKKAVQDGNERHQLCKKVDFGFYVKTFRNYVEMKFKSEGAPAKANLVLFIDSLCRFSSTAEEALVQSYNNLLAENGVILVTLWWNDQDFWFKIREIYGNNRSIQRTAVERNDYLTIQQIQEIAQKHGWKFQLFTPEYRLDVTECFKPDSQDGRYLLDCLLCFSNYLDEVEFDHQKLLNFLHEEASINENERWLVGKHSILLISKQ